MAVIQDHDKKEYNYLSRYSVCSQFWNSFEKKRYYGTALQLSRKIGSHLTHTVLKGDTLDSISLKYYNTPLYWWVIADINSIQDPLMLNVNIKLIIPDINEIVFTESIR